MKATETFARVIYWCHTINEPAMLTPLASARGETAIVGCDRCRAIFYASSPTDFIEFHRPIAAVGSGPTLIPIGEVRVATVHEPYPDGHDWGSM